MATEIEIEHSRGKYENYFCKENPYEVLVKLVNKFNVKGFNSVELQEYSRGKNNEYYKIKIGKFLKKGLEATEKFDEINFPEFPKIKRTEKEKRDLIKRFGQKYLIKNTEKHCPTFIKLGIGSTGEKPGEVENYFETRFLKPDNEKEKNLMDITIYATVLLGTGLSFSDLEGIILSKP